MRTGIRRIQTSRALRFAVAGTTCLEFMGCLVLLDLILVVKTVIGLGDAEVGIVGGCVGLGAACGSYVSGRISRSQLRPFYAILGIAGVALTLVNLSAVVDFRLVAALVCVLGTFGGGAVVPLYALLQREARTEERGQIIACNNFLNMTGVLLASGCLWLLNDLLGLAPEHILFWSGAVLLLIVCVALRCWPEYGFASFLQTVLVASRRAGSSSRILS